MSGNFDNFKAWYVQVLEGLYDKRDAGIAVLMISLPLLERYLRRQQKLVPADAMSDGAMRGLSAPCIGNHTPDRAEVSKGTLYQRLVSPIPVAQIRKFVNWIMLDKRQPNLENLALTDIGATPQIITGSGTGSHRIDLELGIFTELQVGSYVFMDDQYRACDLSSQGSDPPPYEDALFVDASVISANAKGMVTVDAGYKAFATEGAPPSVGSNAPQDARFAFMGDEHGAVIAPGIETGLSISDRVVLGIPHCDPTVDLYDSYHVVRGDTLVDIWPVSCRGRSR